MSLSKLRDTNQSVRGKKLLLLWFERFRDLPFPEKKSLERLYCTIKGDNVYVFLWVTLLVYLVT